MSDSAARSDLGVMGLTEPSSADHGGDVLYDIGKCEEVGRYMVAKRDLEPGEVIFTDQPAVIGPDSNSLPLCTVCWRYNSSSILSRDWD